MVRVRWWVALLVVVVLTTGATAFVPGIGWGWRLLDGSDVLVQGDGFPDEASAEAAATEALGSDWPGATVDGTWHYVGDPDEPALENGWDSGVAAFRIREAGAVDIVVNIGASGGPSDVTAFTLAEEFRPTSVLVAPFLVGRGRLTGTSDVAVAILSMDSDGSVNVESGFDSILASGSFYLENP